MKTLRKFLFFLFFFLIAVKSSYGTVVIEGSFKEDIESSHLIIATTISKIEYAETAPGDIVTKLFLANTEVIKGDPVEVPRVLTIEGGEINDKKVKILGIPEYKAGERYIFFLRFDNLICPIIGLGLRSFIVERGPVTGKEVIFNYNRRNVYGIKNDRVNLSDPSESDLKKLNGESSMQKREFVDIIRAIMNQQDYTDFSKNIPKRMRGE